MVVYQFRQVAFFLQHRSLRRLVFAALVVGHRLAFFALKVLPANFELVLVFVVAHRVPRMVYAQKTPPNFCATKVVHGEIGAPLIFVLEPPEALGFARFLVAYEL